MPRFIGDKHGDEADERGDIVYLETSDGDESEIEAAGEDEPAVNPSVYEDEEAVVAVKPPVYRKWGNECLPEKDRRRCCPPLPKNLQELGISIDVIRALEVKLVNVLPLDYIPIDEWEKANNKGNDKDDSGEEPDKDEYESLIAKATATLKAAALTDADN